MNLDQFLIQSLQELSISLNRASSLTTSIVNHLQKSSDQPHIETDQIRSDQSQDHLIRSDQISNSHSTSFEKFRDIASQNGINLASIDLSSISRNIDWFLMNSSSIMSKANYIRKMVAGLPEKPSVGFQVPSPAPVPEDDTKCLGYDIELVCRVIPLITREIFLEARTFVPSWKSLFSSWHDVQKNPFKIRVIACYAMKHDLVEVPEA